MWIDWDGIKQLEAERELQEVDMNVTSQQLGNMKGIGWQEMTVAELVSKLAGLPPMMEVFCNADGTAMFVNDVQIEQEQATEARPAPPPFLRIICSEKPSPPKPPSVETVEEQTARQSQRAMDLAHNIQRAEQMPEGLHNDL